MRPGELSCNRDFYRILGGIRSSLITAEERRRYEMRHQTDVDNESGEIWKLENALVLPAPKIPGTRQ